MSHNYESGVSQEIELRGVVFPSRSLEPSPFATCVGYMRSQRVPFFHEGWIGRTVWKDGSKGSLKGWFGMK